MKWAYWIIGALLVVGLINSINDDGGREEELTLVESERPEQQKQFIAIVQKAVADWKDETGNDLARRKALYDALAMRSHRLCDLLGFSNLSASSSVPKVAKIKDWTGYVDTLAHSGQLGVLSVKLHTQSTTWNDNIRLKTWNNAVSDIHHKTRIRPESPVYDTVLTLTEGDEIYFSGTFFYDGKEECIVEASMSLERNAKDPEFIFHFDDIGKLVRQEPQTRQPTPKPPIQ